MTLSSHAQTPLSIPGEADQIHATIFRMPDEALTFVTLHVADGDDRRFSVRGVEAPYEVAYLVDFDAIAMDRVGRDDGHAPAPVGSIGRDPHHAWFTIDPSLAEHSDAFEVSMVPQLTAIHGETMRSELDPA